MRRRARNYSISETRAGQNDPLMTSTSLSPRRPSRDARRDLMEKHFNEQIPIRLMRHTSLVLPSTQNQHQDEFHLDKQTPRQRMNSWSGLHSLLNPNCPIHGRRALIEAYAMNKYLKMSQELNQGNPSLNS